MSHIGTFCGFGEIAKNYGPRLAKLKFPDMRIIMMVPEKHLGVLGMKLSISEKSMFVMISKK